MDDLLNQLTYERFKKDIMTFVLKPGDSVSAAKIADRYNVSRTPAREALVRLEAEGLVDIIPKSKSVISKIDLAKARQEWFVRSSLELAMVDKFFENVTPGDIQEMKRCNKEMLLCKKAEKSHENSYRYQLFDNEFHAVTYRVSGENLAAEVIAGKMAHYYRLRFLTELNDTYQDRTVNGHEKLIELVESGDREGYREALKMHLGYILDDIKDMGSSYEAYFA